MGLIDKHEHMYDVVRDDEEMESGGRRISVLPGQ